MPTIVAPASNAALIVASTVASNAWFSPGSLSFEMAKGIPAAVISLLAAFGVSLIAFRQYQVARAKFKLDLFERRLEIFTETRRFLLESLRPDPALGELDAFVVMLDRATFLFGDDIRSYIQQAMHHRGELWRISLATRANGDVVPLDRVQELSALEEWVGRQVETGCSEKFRLYLDFGAWR